MKTVNYESPKVEIVEIEVEQGFAISGEDGNWQPDVTSFNEF